MNPYGVGVLIVLLSYSTSAQSDTCYYANGKPLRSDDPFQREFKPCTSGGPSTICCATNRKNPSGGEAANGFTIDECLPNGLCQNRIIDKGTESTTYWVDFCTDQNLSSPNCLNVCNGTRNALDNSPLTPCNGRADSDTWCCGQNNDACCKSGIGIVKIPQKFNGSATTMSVSLSVTPSSTQWKTFMSASRSTSSSIASSSSITQISSPLASASNTDSGDVPQEKSSISGGTIRGIVIGVLAGFVMLAAIIVLGLLVRKYKNQAKMVQDESQLHVVKGSALRELELNSRYEVHGTDKSIPMYAELYSRPEAVELSSPPPNEVPAASRQY